MVYACAWNDDAGLHNAYMKKIRLDITEDAGRVDKLTRQLITWGYGFERRLAAAKAGVNMEGDPAAQTFASEWKQLKHDFDSYMGEVSDSNRMELEALFDEKEQFDVRLAELPVIKVPHYPTPPKAPEVKPDEQQPEPHAFVVRGAHRSDGSETNVASQ